MADAYEVLELHRDADAEAIRRRYLELVRKHPPEREPARFAEIRAAYDRLRDPVVNLEQRLFDPVASESFEGLLAGLRTDVRRDRVPTDVLLSLARS